MSRANIASTSNLQISVEPSQSSFFAGEDFRCTITFTNTHVAVPQSVPLPAISAFESHNNNSPNINDVNRRAISMSVNTLHNSATPTAASPRLASPILGSFPHNRIRHGKSQSMDIRTFARQNQLQSTYGGTDEDVGTDEVYYRNMIEERERENEESRDYYLHQEILDNLPERRRLIGKSLLNRDFRRGERKEMKMKPFSSTPAKKHGKSHSIAAPGHHPDVLPTKNGLDHSDTPYAPSTPPQRIPSKHIPIQANAPSPSPAMSRSASGTFRQPSGPIASSHPHSRKKSLAQIQAEDLSGAFELEGDTPTPSDSITSRESIDSRGKSNGKSNGFYGLGENSSMESTLREDVTHWSKMNHERNRRDSTASNSTLNTLSGEKLRVDSSVPGVETLLWAFAQFGGAFEIDESLIKPGEFEQVKGKLIGRNGMPGNHSPLAAIGGGNLGSANGHEQNKEGWGSYLRGALSFRASSDALNVSNSHRRTSSSLDDVRSKTLTSKSIPIFSNPPSMVAVDLNLSPGESRTYSFRLPLPPDLPPSYSGRAISFTYTLTLGTNRLVRNKRGHMEQKSRMVRIPLRVYNLVNISGVTSFFDLTNPIVNLKDLAETREEDAFQLPNITSLSMKESRRRDSLSREDTKEKDLLGYAEVLLSTCKSEISDEMPTDVEVAIELAKKRTSSSDLEKLNAAGPTSPRSRSHLQLLPDPIALKTKQGLSASKLDAGLGLSAVDDDDMPKSSLQAVEILSRNSPKVSYDISRDGQVAAVLTLIKSKYRLGDTVHGVVMMNSIASNAKVVRISSTLESHEEIEATLSTLPLPRAQKMTKKIHAESHENTLDTGRVGFSLPIPSGATPDFVTSAVKLAWTVRLSFLMLSTVRQGESALGKIAPPPHLVADVDDGYSSYHRAYRAAAHLAGNYSSTQEQTKLEIVECAVPLTVLAHSTKFTAGQVAFCV